MPLHSVAEGAPAHGVVAHLLPSSFKPLVTAWLAEDTPSLDYGGFVVGEGLGEARLLGKSEGIVAGVPFVNEVFAQLDCSVEWHVAEGQSIQAVTHCATVRGPVRKILLGCSGIATQSARTLALVRKAGYKNTLAGTRKTTPGFRLVEKYGMLVGGADGHRHDLSSMVMLKDNHIWACSGVAASNPQAQTVTSALAQSASETGGQVADNAAAITTAVSAAKAAAGFSVKVEVECQSEAEAEAAIRAGADVVMLDNFEPGELKQAAKRLKDRLGNTFLIEVSGGLTDANVADYVSEHVDVISTSSIHQGVKHVDFSLKVIPRGQAAKQAAGGESVAV